MWRGPGAKFFKEFFNSFSKACHKYGTRCVSRSGRRLYYARARDGRPNSATRPVHEVFQRRSSIGAPSFSTQLTPGTIDFLDEIRASVVDPFGTRTIVLVPFLAEAVALKTVLGC